LCVFVAGSLVHTKNQVDLTSSADDVNMDDDDADDQDDSLGPDAKKAKLNPSPSLPESESAPMDSLDSSPSNTDVGVR
jgi:hypothetical protein